MKYDLECRYDARNSFYGKAQVKEEEHNGKHGKTRQLALYSYNTLVATITYFDIDGEKRISYVCYGKYSQTTTRHQKEFFKQNGLSDAEIKDLFKNGVLEVQE